MMTMALTTAGITAATTMIAANAFGKIEQLPGQWG